MSTPPKTEQEKLKLEADLLLEATLVANLKMTAEERIAAHENARKLMIDLQAAGKEARAKSR